MCVDDVSNAGLFTAQCIVGILARVWICRKIHSLFTVQAMHGLQMVQWIMGIQNPLVRYWPKMQVTAIFILFKILFKTGLSATCLWYFELLSGPVSSRPSLFSLVQCQSWGDKSVLLKRPAGQLLKAEGAERMLSLSARCSWGKRFKRNRGEPLKAHLGLILHKDLPSHWMFHRSAWESAEEGLDSIKAFHSWRVIINSEEDFDFFLIHR